uniref:Uncharacterized protein n=1 Tax=Branchiostoma floridae TaxID=7739 RepID=C3ZBH8_BRAFL|eukprot:XP_002594204.1 hypothetical protein BRAFLDRAFT_65053 [Branchiostoma floridae]
MPLDFPVNERRAATPLEDFTKHGVNDDQCETWTPGRVLARPDGSRSVAGTRATATPALSITGSRHPEQADSAGCDRVRGSSRSCRGKSHAPSQTDFAKLFGVVDPHQEGVITLGDGKTLKLEILAALKTNIFGGELMQRVCLGRGINSALTPHGKVSRRLVAVATGAVGARHPWQPVTPHVVRLEASQWQDDKLADYGRHPDKERARSTAPRHMALT